MSRSQFRFTVKDQAGNVVQNADVWCFAVGTAVVSDTPTGTAITGSAYTARTGGSVVTFPIVTNSQGDAEAWFDTPQTVDVVATDNSDAAYYPGTPTVAQPFTAFKEVVTVGARAEDVQFTATGNLAATTVQAAIEEVNTEGGAAALATHEADTSNVHGIADATVLATDAEVATAVSDHSADTTSIHGIADTSVLATDAELAAHEADTTSIHGIANTANLETSAGAQTKVDAHVNDASDAHDASAVSVVPFSTIAATNVQSALEEVLSEAGGGAHALDSGTHTGDLNDSQLSANVPLKDAENVFSEHNAFGATAAVDQPLLGFDGVTETPAFSVASFNETLVPSSFLEYHLGFRGDFTVDPTVDGTLSLIYAADFVARTAIGSTVPPLILAAADMYSIHRGTGEVGAGYGMVGSAQNMSTGSIAVASGVQGNVVNDTTGAITEARGVYVKTWNKVSGGTVTTDYGIFVEAQNAGTITTHYGTRINSPATGAGLTNNYGLYLADHSGAGSTNSYNLYSAGASSKNLFIGTVQVDGSFIIPRSTTAAPTAEASMAWDSDDDALKVGTGSSTKTLADTDHTHAPSSDARLIVKTKTANESVTSSAVLQDDDHLFFTAAANKEYTVDLVLLVTGSPGDIQWLFTVPSGATMRYWPTGTTPIGTTSATSGAPGATVSSNSASAPDAIQYKLFLTTGGTAGTVQFQWAQGSSSGTATVVYRGSSLVAMAS